MAVEGNAVTARLGEALGELKRRILERYPDATFRIERGHDDPEAIHLVTTVDVADTDEVLEAVIERMMELQIEEGLPIFVIPVRSRTSTPVGRGAADAAGAHHRTGSEVQ